MSANGPSGRHGQPTRLDLDDVHVKAARDAGVLLSLASDVHSAEQFARLDGAVLQARRGWLRKEDVLNARPVGELRALLRAGCSGHVAPELLEPHIGAGIARRSPVATR
jgi:histidinol phosphatase-like PHP family hydrolase